MKGFRKLMLSVATLGLLTVALTTTTYAWFKVNSHADVSGFEFNATGGMGFLISVDGKNFGNEISTLDMKKAMIVGYNPSEYAFDGDGDLTYTVSNKTTKITEVNDINQIIQSKLLLSPVTSQYGYEMMDMSRVLINGGAESGKYIEFNMYFKASSSNVDENLKYNISLYVGSKDKQIEHTEKTVSSTYMSSDSDKKLLEADMNMMFLKTDDNGLLVPEVVVTPFKKGDEVTMQSVNALRFSTEEKVKDTTAAVASYITDSKVRKEHSQIYEFFTLEDHGSYAVKNGTGIYSPENSASFTYYNNVKISKIQALDEEDQPNTFRYQMGTDYEDEENDILMPTITTVQSGSEVQCVTFRFWLEGWDADCFDGLAKSINVKLTFQSRQVLKKKD